MGKKSFITSEFSVDTSESECESISGKSSIGTDQEKTLKKI